MARLPDAEVLLTPKEVAQRFHVNPKTVTRWAKAGKLTPIRTLGGHRRYRESEVLERLREYKESSTDWGFWICWQPCTPSSSSKD